jgi:predicted KAP-like P-loop ATPase
LPEKKGDTAKNALRKFGAKATALVPSWGWCRQSGGLVKAAIDATGRIEEPSMASLHTDAEKALRLAQKSHLVVVDDIDRLQMDELLMLFKIVRLVGRLPNVHYLLAFDEETVLEGLTGSSVAKDANRAMASLTDEQLTRYAYIQHEFLNNGLDQPRKVHRLFSQIHHGLPLVRNEVDVVDLVLLTHVRLCWPSLHRALSRKGVELISGSAQDHIDYLSRKDVDPKEKLDRWRSFVVATGVSEKDVVYVLAMLGELFPVVAAAHRKLFGNPASLRAGKRVGSGEYFDRYFQLGIPPDDVSDESIVEAMRALAHGLPNDQSIADLRAALKSDRDLVMPKLKSAWIDARSLNPGNFIQFLLDQMAMLEESGGGRSGLLGNGLAEVSLAELIVALPVGDRSPFLARAKGSFDIGSFV